MEILNDTYETPLIKLVNKILLKAFQEEVSEIQIEPQENLLRVNFFRDGILYPALDPFNKKIAPAMVNQFKIMASLDVNKKKVIQNGKMDRVFQGKKLDLWVTISPNNFGEKVKLRIWDSSIPQKGLQSYLLDRETRKIVNSIIHQISGVVLVTGPKRSGKSTTLSSILTEIYRKDLNIATLEKRIKYTIPGIHQVEVNQKTSMDYESFLDSFINQDVDVILIDKLQNIESTSLVFESASKNRLVLSSLEANGVVSSMENLLETNIKPSLIKDNLIGIISQRLIRRVCPECYIKHNPSPEELLKLGISISNLSEANFYQANTLTEAQIKKAKSEGTLCSNCKGIGYKGQIPVYEVLPITDSIKACINHKFDAKELEDIAIKEGMKPMVKAALELALKGETTLEEIELEFAKELAENQNPYTLSSNPANISERLQLLEEQIQSLTLEFQQLKQDFYNSGNTSLENDSVNNLDYQKPLKPKVASFPNQELNNQELNNQELNANQSINPLQYSTENTDKDDNISSDISEDEESNNIKVETWEQLKSKINSPKPPSPSPSEESEESIEDLTDLTEIEDWDKLKEELEPQSFQKTSPKLEEQLTEVEDWKTLKKQLESENIIPPEEDENNLPSDQTVAENPEESPQENNYLENQDLSDPW